MLDFFLSPAGSNSSAVTVCGTQQKCRSNRNETRKVADQTEDVRRALNVMPRRLHFILSNVERQQDYYVK